MTKPVIRVEKVGKRYVLGRQQTGRRYRALRDDLMDAVKAPWHWARRGLGSHDSPSQEEDFWALQDVGFEVGQGEVVGIIGRNGAGKSTLLKILSRITEPTTGRITLKGRVASLLEVGTGFHPELTGRENIFLNGAILGMHRSEIKAKFDEIVAFAEVEKFLDTPVKRYSSGMYVRLAFAVAAHLEPEILVVDEVLAVGDAEFQQKCLGKMKSVAEGDGRTVLFVSHQMNAVQALCSHCLLLAQGRLQASGRASEVISDYLRVEASAGEWTNSGSQHANPYFKPIRFALVDKDIQPFQRDIRGNEDIGVLIDGDVTITDSALCFGFAVYTAEGTLLYWSLHTDTARQDWPEVRPGMNRFVCWLPRHLLNEGEYRLEFQASLHHRVWLCQPGVNSPVLHFKLRGGLSSSPLWMERRPGQLAPVLPFIALVS